MRNPVLIEEMKTYRGRDEVPLDFDAFWDSEIKKLSALQDYQLEELFPHSLEERRAHRPYLHWFLQMLTHST